MACSLADAPLTYSGTKDTPKTITGIKKLNQTGKNLGCW